MPSSSISGLDSIGGVTWVRKINETYQTSIEATKVYSYPTLAQLSRYVREEAETQGTLSSPGAGGASRPARGVREERLVQSEDRDQAGDRKRHVPAQTPGSAIASPAPLPAMLHIPLP